HVGAKVTFETLLASFSLDSPALARLGGIVHFIDPQATILWLTSTTDCPSDALGFDFDGATFTHVGAKVTFETLLASFSLDSPALARLGGIVHFID
ncbi:hypothetical protein D9B96_12195, partial [Corynebacterium diphtheriae]